MNFADDLDKYLDATRKRLKPELDRSTNNTPIDKTISTQTPTTLPDHERYLYNAERDIWYDVLTHTYSKYDTKRQYYIPVTFGNSIKDTPTDENNIYDKDDEPDSDATCRLVVLSSTVIPVGQVILTDANGMILGRDKHEWDTRTTRLRDMQVSKIHCQVFYDHDRHIFAVTDMGSQNGTLLNGERLSPAKQSSRPFDLTHGDELTLGVTVFQVHLHDHGWPCQQCQTSAVNPTTTNCSTPTSPIKKLNSSKKATPTRKQWQKQLLKEYDDDTQSQQQSQQQQHHQQQHQHQQQERRYIDRARLRRERVSATMEGADIYNNPSETSIERPAEVVDLQTPVQGKGYDMLRKMGWQNGQGMGSAQQGITVPLAPKTTPYARAGLGVSMDLASKKERLYHQMKQRYGQ